ncbi:MAG: hypothetical protein KA116_08780 [Proteobacteria bacterium]|nr:hypothetical protein [Pseudomonadota bacterium]
MSKRQAGLTTQTGLQVMAVSQVPTDPKGNVIADLYVRIPTLDRYVLFVHEGEKLDEEKMKKLYLHPDPKLYGSKDKLKKNRKKTLNATINAKDDDPNKLGAETQELITDLYLDLLEDNNPSESQIKKLGSIVHEITENILSDTKSFEDNILKQFKDLSRMEDSYAIRSLTTLFGLANGYSSKRAMIDIQGASMFMDINLLDFRKDDIEEYYKNPEGWPSGFLKLYMQHPAKANLMATMKLPDLSETGLQMILNHHEYNNGEGFPRGTRTKSLPDLVKILSLAVDVFQILKRQELLNNPSNIPDALMEAAQNHREVHERRHQGNIVDRIFSYMAIDAAQKKIIYEKTLANIHKKLRKGG